jgi:putative ABC transport system permease protein
LSNAPPSQALRLVVHNRIALVLPMPESYRNRIRQIPGVREVMSSQWFGGVYKDSRDPKNFFARFAIEPDKIFTLRSEMEVPEDQRRAFQRERTGCLIGKRLADKHNFHLGDRIFIRGDIFPFNLELTVRAIYNASENNATLYFSREYLEQGFKGGLQGNVGTFLVLADSAESVPRIAKVIDSEFHNSPIQTQTETERAFALSFVAMLGNVKVFLLIVCAAVTFTILLVSANTIAMSVRERVREVGVLKTLGFTPGAILGMILGESVAISLIGGIAGCVLSILMCRVVRNGPAVSDELTRLSLRPSVALACLAVAMAIGLVSAFVPAWKASHTGITDALRSAD